MNKMNIVIPMAGRGSRFVSAGFSVPKPLIPLGGKPMIQWVVENVRPARPHRFIFLVLADHIERHPDVELTLRGLCPGCEIVRVSEVTEGAACTVLLARGLINEDAPLMIANSDQYVDADINDYLAEMDRAEADGLIMTFWSDHPKWSYCRLDEHGGVLNVVEKQVVSNEATVGIYNFRRGSDFVRAADQMIRDDTRVNGEFYVAPTYNLLIAAGGHVVPMNIGREFEEMHGLGTPEDFVSFQECPSYQAACGANGISGDFRVPK
jgi:dTDP-glucose pyrophosphorylase